MMSHLTFTVPYNRSLFNYLQFIVEQLILNKLHNLGKVVRISKESNGNEFEQALGDGEGQGSLVGCSLWGHRESDTTKRRNNNLAVCEFQHRLS